MLARFPMQARHRSTPVFGVLTLDTVVSSPTLPLELTRETRERFVAATVDIVVPAAQAIRERLTSLASQTGNVRDMQEHRDDLLAFRSLE